jgi:hypothetical protein
MWRKICGFNRRFLNNPQFLGTTFRQRPTPPTAAARRDDNSSNDDAHCFPLLSVLEQLSRLDGESATGHITAGDDDEQKLNQDLKWRHLAGLIGRHEISTQEIVARGRAPDAGKPFGIIH